MGSEESRPAVTIVMGKPKQNLPPYERYILQWVTKWDDDNHITQILGYCVRDRNSFNWRTVLSTRTKLCVGKYVKY